MTHTWITTLWKVVITILIISEKRKHSAHCPHLCNIFPIAPLPSTQSCGSFDACDSLYPPVPITPTAQNAFKCYVRSRDYCTTAGHLVSMCLRVIKAAIELGNFMHVANYVAKAEQATQAAVREQDQ